MKLDEFKILEKKYVGLRCSWSGGAKSLLIRMAWSGTGLYLSFLPQWELWLLGQLIFGFSMFHWFSILHDCGHNAFFPNRKANEITGFVASLVCFVPYSSWKYIHLEHHRWTGWLDQDPSTRDLLKVTAAKRWLARWVWKSYFPAFALAFLFGTFWNLRKLLGLFKSPVVRLELVFNLALILAIHIWIAQVSGMWWTLFAMAFIFFGLVCEPIILSQHAHISMEKEQPNPTAFSLHEQDQFTRALVFPTWISKYLTLSFENHIAHHFFPWIPSYLLYQVKTSAGNEVVAFQWIWAARKIPGDVLVFDDRKQTGLNI